MKGAYSARELAQFGCGDPSGIRKWAARHKVKPIFRIFEGNKTAYYPFEALRPDWQQQIKANGRVHMGAVTDEQKDMPHAAGLLAARIREVRLSLGLTQREIGARCGVSVQSWNNYERGKNQPGVQVLAEIFRFGVDINWLLTGTRQSSAVEPAVQDVREDPGPVKAQHDKCVRIHLAISIPGLPEQEYQITPVPRGQRIEVGADPLLGPHK